MTVGITLGDGKCNSALNEFCRYLPKIVQITHAQSHLPAICFRATGYVEQTRKEGNMAEGTVGPAVVGREDVHVTGRRVLAIIVDSIVLGLIFAIMSMFFGTTSANGSMSASTNGIPALISFVVFLLYFTLFEGYLGQTLGKMLLGIQRST